MSQSVLMPDLVQTTSEQAASQPIDMEHLLHYTMGDEKLAREVLCLFSTQGRLYLEQLASTTSANEQKIAAHTLKGSAQGVGAHDVAGKALVLEQMAGSEDKAAWNHALSELKTAFAAAGSYIADLS